VSVTVGPPGLKVTLAVDDVCSKQRRKARVVHFGPLLACTMLTIGMSIMLMIAADSMILTILFMLSHLRLFEVSPSRRFNGSEAKVNVRQSGGMVAETGHIRLRIPYVLNPI